jgi:ubiquinone/menaquinone biosynthesis C-methylase UbiE
MVTASRSDQAEELRIREAYHRRDHGPASDRYSYFEATHLLNQQQLERILLSRLKQLGYAPLSEHDILEVGCGTGTWLQRLLLWGASPYRLKGVDLLEGRIAAARESLPAAVHLECGNAAKLPFRNSSFDLVFQCTVFTSIFSAEMKSRIAGEMTRVLRPGGHIIWYDFFVNNPFNRDVRGIAKPEIRGLFRECRGEFVRVTLAPPLGRSMGCLSPGLSALALYSRLLCTHYLGFLEKA